MDTLDPKTLKKGDRFVESEYGRVLFGTVLTKPRVQNELLIFKAAMSDGRTVDYAFHQRITAYNPRLWPVQMYEGIYHES
jgi:hypothetical protein